MTKIKYALLYDFHTMSTFPDVGTEFDAEAFAEQIKSCGVDFLTWHARCNQGNAYYDTKIGTRHPSLKFDLVRELCEACHRRGIRIRLYFNGQLSDEELIRHREWNMIDFDGQAYFGGDLPRKFSTPYARRVCYNSPYREHLRDMVLELAENYPVDGFFFDCLSAHACVCEHCMAEMKAKGIDYTDRNEVEKFGNYSAHRLCEFLSDAISKVLPEAQVYFNGRPSDEIAHLEDPLVCECLPTAGWGYECLPVAAHHLRTIAGKDKSVLNMTGRFNDWGDFGGLRTAEGLEYDLFYGVANGMRPEIGGHCHPRGDMDLPVFDRIREVYGNMQQYDQWSFDAVNEPEIALVYPRRGLVTVFPFEESVIAAVRMLTELKVQFDLVTDFSSWDNYKLLIFPDDVEFTPEYAERVKRHLARGGKVLATSRSGLTPDGSAFALGGLWPAKYEGKLEFDPVYFQPEGKFAHGLPDMPLSVYAGGSKVSASENADTEMYLVEAYFKTGWDGMRSNYYAPPKKIAGEPFLLRKGNIIYCSAELFAGYGQRAPQQIRTLLGNILNELVPEPRLKCSNMPSFTRAFVQSKGNMQMIHVLAYCPEKRCNAMALEDRITLVDTEFQLRTDGKNISKVYLAPERTPLDFEVKNGYCTVQVPKITGYALIVFE